MTTDQAVARQAAHENQWGRALMLRPETIEHLQDVLARIDDVHKLSPKEIGRLQWAAFCALTDLQVDLKFGGVKQ
ncbi:hypothetical protein [Cupriavidus pinatubonensis]|uniref:hypothetical protein n=1 Tax=Cupriavidus pinatubonensis TaxID=248026 RepID=UPI003615CF0C